MKLISKYLPRDVFLEMHARWQRFAIVVAHRRCGKTVAAVNDLIDKAIQCKLENPRYAYIAPFYSQAKSVAWDYLLKFTEGIQEKVMVSELSVVLIGNGAKIRLFGGDNPDSLRGLYFDGVVLDEVGDMAPRIASEIIRPALSDRKGWCLYIGTPKSVNHFFDVWTEARESPDRWYSLELKASQTGIIDEEELLDAKASMETSEYEAEFECSFYSGVRGSYYTDQIKAMEAEGRAVPQKYDPDLEVITGWDLGWSDDTAVIFAQVRRGEISIIDYLSVSGMAIPDIVEELFAKPYAYGQFFLPHDARAKSLQTGRSIQEQMWSFGIKTAVIPSLSVQDGIQAVRSVFPKVWIDPVTCKDLISSLRLYQREYDDKKKVFRAVPRHDWTSHGADAMRYLCLGLNPATTKRADRMFRAKNAKGATERSNVLTLESLYKDRQRANSGPKRV